MATIVSLPSTLEPSGTSSEWASTWNARAREWRYTAQLASQLTGPSCSEMSRLVVTLGDRLAAQHTLLAAADPMSPRRLESMRKEFDAISDELAIVRATLRGRVQDPPAGRLSRQENPTMSNKTWLFDPDDVAELREYADDDSDDDDWADWDSDADDDDEDLYQGRRLQHDQGRPHFHHGRHRRRTPSHRMI